MLTIIMAIESEHERNKLIEIYEKYYSTMMYTAKEILSDHTLAEDAVSEAFIKIMHNLNKISDASCYKTRGYIVIIVRNTALNILKKRMNHKEESEDMLEDIGDKDLSILDSMTNGESCKVIIDAIRSLPETLSDVLYLSVVGDYTNTEISELLGLSYDVVKMRLSRAKKIIRKNLGGDDYGE